VKTINSAIKVIPIVERLSPRNVEKIIKGSKLVLDGLDNFETRFIVNDACVKSSIPWIHGAVLSTYGITMSIIPDKTPCLRCILQKLPNSVTISTIEQVGILNTVPIIIGSIESTEALKLLINQRARETLLFYDIWHSEFSEIKIKRLKNCKCCAKHEFEFLTKNKQSV
jgi:adenylyltransferase/sulfurtransferase